MQPSRRRLFAVIPAAGRSRRMGKPKLLLPLGEQTVIGRLLTTLSSADLTTYVLIHPDDNALLEEIGRTRATVIQPAEAPAEMRVSVEHLLRAIQDRHDPQPEDGWLLIPADHPLLSADVLGQLIARWPQSAEQILVPTYQGRRGHPTLFSWKLAADVFSLPAGVGVNQLVRQHAEHIEQVPVDDITVTLDLDTPADYERARQIVAAES